MIKKWKMPMMAFENCPLENPKNTKKNHDYLFKGVFNKYSMVLEVFP